MGTSQSKPPLKGGKPLVPSWGEQDPAAPDGAPPAAESAPTDVAPAPNPADTLPPRALTGMRRALRAYYGSGDPATGRRAVGRFARTAGAGGAARYARASRSGGAAFAGMMRAAAGLEPSPGALDVRTLAGRPLEDAISAIVDAFCPSGILDEEAIRLAMGEALFEVLGDDGVFRPEAMDDRSLLVAARCFVAEVVFASMMAESGQSADQVPPAQAIARENGLRDLIREVADHVGTPLLQEAGALLTPQTMQAVVQRITDTVLTELREWE